MEGEVTWLDTAKAENHRAVQRLKESEMLEALAVEAYRRKQDKPNRIALQAATRLVKEAKAQLEEWKL